MILSIVVVVLSECHICQGTAVHVLLWFPSLHYFYFYCRPFFYRSTFRTLVPAVLKFWTHEEWPFFFGSFLSPFLHFIVFLLFALFVWYGTLWFHMHFFLNTRRLRSFFSFWYTSDFLSSLFFCTCDKSASTSIRGIYYTYLYKTYRHLRRL